MQYGTVTGRILATIADRVNDPDANPDTVPVAGTVRFTPSVSSVISSTAGAIIMPTPIEADLDSEGYLSLNGVRGVTLVATDSPDLNPTGFTYTVSFIGLKFDKFNLDYKSFSMALPADSTVDLSTVTPVGASNGALIIRGAQGEPGEPGGTFTYDAVSGLYTAGSAQPLPSIDASTLQFPTAIRQSIAANLTNTSTLEGAAAASQTNGFLRWQGTTPGAVPVPKPAGDVRAGVWEMTNNSESGYLFHLLLGANANHQNTALLALGVDNDGIGLLVPNKLKGRGIVGDQRATVTAADAYWMHATQRSPGSPLVRFEMQANDAAPLMQLLAFGTPGVDQKLLYIGDPSGQAGVINAADGSIEWRRNITVQDPASGSGTSAIAVMSNNGVAAASRQHTRHVKDGLEYYNPTGTAGTWWPFKIAAGGSHLQIRAGGSTSAVGTLPTMVNMIDVQNGKLSFFGAAAIAQPAGMGAAATDAATTQALVNNLRTALINLGLVTA